MSGVSIIMAGALRRDLLARGVHYLDIGECEAMIARMFDCVRTIERGTQPARRCETNLIAREACGAIQGEACQAPREQS